MRKFGDLKKGNIVAIVGELSSDKTVTIDKELPNYLTYIVDEKLELVSIGSEGESVDIVRIF